MRIDWKLHIALLLSLLRILTSIPPAAAGQSAVAAQPDSAGDTPASSPETPSVGASANAPAPAETAPGGDVPGTDSRTNGPPEATTSGDVPGTDSRTAAPDAPAGTFSGRVLEAGSRDPIEDATVTVTGAELEASTDASGLFQLEGASPGHLTLIIVAPGYTRNSLEVDVRPGESTFVTVYLVPRTDRPYAMKVETRRALDEVNRYSLSTEDTRYVPGTFGDPVRAIQNLPGVNRSPYALGLLIIRGSFPYESGYFLNGAEFPLLYHFLGVTSAVNGDLLDRIDYLPGGYGVRYGRLLGGIVNLEFRNEFPGRLHGYADIDLLDSSLYIQGSVGSRLSYAIAARRSYMDFFLEPVIAQLQSYQIRAPRYWDAQLRLNYQATPRTDLHLTLMGSSDEFAVLGRIDPTTGSAANGQASVEYTTTFSKAMLEARTRFSDRLAHGLTLSIGPESEHFKYGGALVEASPTVLSLRDEWSFRWNRDLLFRAGLDLQATHYRFDLEVPDADNDTNYTGEAYGISPSPYLEAEWNVLPALTLQPGIRVDPFWVPDEGYSAVSVDPRLAARWQLSPSTSISASAGQYSQFPQPSEFFEELGTNTLSPEHAIQLAVGGKHRVNPLLGVELTLYYNALRDLVTVPVTPEIPIEQFLLDPTSLYSLEVPLYANDGRGRAYGLELMLRRFKGERFSGWLAYSLSHSERQDHPGDRWYNFDYDQTHVLTLLGTYELPRRWSVGARFRYATGSPFTPYSNRYQNLNTGGYLCVEDPAQGLNYARLDPYHTLDIRADKTFLFNRWKMDLSLEVQNVYNRQNVEIPYYSYDCSRTMAIYGLPILPVLGLKGEF